MKKSIGLAGVAAWLAGVGGLAYGQSAEVLNERLSDVEQRLDEVEKRSILDKIYLSGEYRTIFNSYIYNSTTDTNGEDQVTEELWSHRLRVNLVAEPVKSVRVTARLAMYKHFGDNDGPAFVPDFERSRLPRDTVARFDQAWLDWFITDWLAISGGRIAYSGGPPADLQNNNPTRQATWGTSIVDGEYDTVNLTIKLPGPDTYIRLFYTSFLFDSADDDLPFLDDGTESLRVVGGNVEWSVPALGRNLFQFSYLIVPRWTLFPSAITDPGYDADADFRNAPGALAASNIFPSKLPDSLGTWQNISGLIILYDLFESGLDIFVSGSVGLINSSGEGVEYEIPISDEPGAPRASTPLLFFAGTEEDGQVITTFLYTGFRYELPLEALNRPKVGVEFNMGSRFLISLQQATDRLVSKLETRGYAVEGYALFPMNESLFVRLGYLHIQRDFGFTFAGPNPAISGSTAPRVDDTIHNFSLTLSASI